MINDNNQKFDRHGFLIFSSDILIL